MWWPSPSDYQDTLQNPRVAFADIELRDGVVVSDALGLPKPISGSFATVYQVDYHGRRHAVRCFLRHVPDIAQRYAAISAYLQQTALPYTVEFSFLPQGIRMRGQWFPIVKMDWLEGNRLDVFIAQHLNDPPALLEITRQFLILANSLRQANIAHGDLQHGNLLVVNHQLRLLDYDGMFVPTLGGRACNELGQPNYQHPQRSARDYGPYLDNFSVWVITLSLLGLALDPDLRFSFAGGGEALLLQHSDFVDPVHSKMLTALQRSGNPTLRFLTQSFLPFLFARDLSSVPPLEPNAIAALYAARPAQSALPDWLRDRIPVAPAAAGTPASHASPAPAAAQTIPAVNGADWLFDHLQTPAPQRLNGSFLAEKSILTVSALAFVFLFGFVLFGPPIDPLFGISMLSLVPLVGVILLTVGFSLRSNNPERREAARLVQTLEQEQDALAAQVEELTERRAGFEQAQQNALEKLVKQQTDLAAQEKNALAALDHSLTGELAKLDAQRKKLDAQQAEALDGALGKFQASKLQQMLEGFRIADAMLPGIISRELKQSLATQGFVTAADIVDFRVDIFNSSKRFRLINRRGLPVYVEGLDSKRGVALILWRHSMEARVKRLLPDKLSPEAVMALRKKYQDERISLQLTELKKKQEVKNSQARLTERNEKERARLTREMQELPGQFHRGMLAAEQELSQLRKALAEKEWSLVQARRRLSGFANLNFFNYLKSILGR